MTNKDEIVNSDGTDEQIEQQPALEIPIEPEKPEESKLHKQPDLKLRYILPSVFSLLLLILLLISYGEVPEIINDFAISINTRPESFVDAPDQPNRFAKILQNIPKEITKFEDIPIVPDYNLVGSIAQNVVIEDRVDSVVYTLVYVNNTDKLKRIVIHFLDSDGKIAEELKLYSANRMKENYRIYKVDETLITFLHINGQDIVVVQQGTNLDEAEDLCFEIFPEIKNKAKSNLSFI